MIHSQKEISIGHFGAMDDSNIHHHLISISLWHLSFFQAALIFQFSIVGQFLTGSANVLRSKLAAIFARGRFNQFLWLSATFSTSLLSASEAWCLQKKSLRSRHGLYNGFDSKTTLKSVHFPYFKSKKTPAFCCCCQLFISLSIWFSNWINWIISQVQGKNFCCPSFSSIDQTRS